MSLRPLLATACLLLIACGNSNNSNDDAGAPRDVSYDFGTGRTIRSACEEQAATRCLNFEKCGSIGERVRYASEDACRSESVEDCVRFASASDIDRPIQFVDRCTASIGLGACGDEARLKGCDPVGETIGPRAEGAPCALNAQCFDGACGVAYGGLLTGCGWEQGCYRRSRVGDPCTDAGICFQNDDLGCDATGHCAPRPTKVGDPCGPRNACPTTLFCNDGVCAQGSLPLGSTCGWPLGCAAGLVCEAGKCRTPRPTKTYELVQLGESCASDPLVQRFCRGDAQCDGGTCVPRLADGERCSYIQGTLCGLLSYCDVEQEKCAPLAACLR